MFSAQRSKSSRRFVRDIPWNLAHVFFEPLPSRWRMFFWVRARSSTMAHCVKWRRLHQGMVNNNVLIPGYTATRTIYERSSHLSTAAAACLNVLWIASAVQPQSNPDNKHSCVRMLTIYQVQCSTSDHENNIIESVEAARSRLLFRRKEN